jgi:hypothetical protein
MNGVNMNGRCVVNVPACLCTGDAALKKELLSFMESHPAVARFAVSGMFTTNFMLSKMPLTVCVQLK